VFVIVKLFAILCRLSDHQIIRCRLLTTTLYSRQSRLAADSVGRQCRPVVPTLTQTRINRVRAKFHYTDPRTLSATRPDRTDGQCPYMSRFSGQVYDQTKSADMSETQAVRGSGLRVHVVAFRNDRTNDKVRSGPSSVIWILTVLIAVPVRFV